MNIPASTLEWKKVQEKQTQSETEVIALFNDLENILSNLGKQTPINPPG